MTMFSQSEIQKPITDFYDYIWLIMYRNKNAEILQGESSALEKIKKHIRITMDKKRLRVALKVLEAIKTEYRANSLQKI